MKLSSTKPKGATTYKETTFGIIDRKELLGLELEGTKKGLEFITKDIPSNINPDLVCELHNISFGWIFPDWAGHYRTIRVEYSGKEAILPHKIPELMVNLCADLETRLKNISHLDDNFINNVVELLAWFQHQFVFIHPFQDYNGRIARMLTIAILLRLDLPPIEIKSNTLTDRKKYLEAMYSADSGDYSKLEKLIEVALNESLSNVNKLSSPHD